MSPVIILDNSCPVPANVAGVFGLDSFADLIVRKRSVRQRIQSLSSALGWGDVIVLDGGPIRSNIAHRLDRTAKSGECAVYLPAYVHLSAQDTEAHDFLEKISYAGQSVAINGADDEYGWSEFSPPLLVLHGGDLLSLLAAPSGEARLSDLQQLIADLPGIPCDFPLLDLRKTDHFLQAVTSTFDARHFNQVAPSDRYTITKRSTNREKLRQEFDVFSWLPPSMRRFFIEPFDFREDSQGASYRMERLLVPDFALQWLHNSVKSADFENFLSHVFYFLEERAVKPCPAGVGKAVADALYLEKLSQRVGQLVELKDFDKVALHADVAFGGVKALLERYIRVYRKLTTLRRYDTQAIIHGDLCFSNMLYNGAQGTLKLIDPRGASSPESMYSDPFYDLAKLSHSLEGAYDYINAGLFSVELDSRGAATLKILNPSRSVETLIFRQQCASIGASSRLVRLYEASLFISMTPLHIDSPLKVLAFLLNGRDILDQVENDALWEQ